MLNFIIFNFIFGAILFGVIFVDKIKTRDKWSILDILIILTISFVPLLNIAFVLSEIKKTEVFELVVAALRKPRF